MTLTALSRVVVVGWCLCFHAPLEAVAQSQPELQVTLTWIARDEPPLEPLSLAQPILKDEGERGFAQGLKDNATTGRFLGHAYASSERIVERDGDVAAVFNDALAAGERLFVSGLREADLRTVMPLAEKAGALVFNARATDDALRVEGCSPAVFHTAPSRAMKADALAQYLLLKRWQRWFLMEGSHSDDQAMAAALKRAAKRYGAKLTDERVYEDTGGSRRTDTGHVQVQAQIPLVTQNAGNYDVLVVADESEVFGDYLPYRTSDPRPVVGTSGLVPTAWDRVHEQWGGTQMQRRFEQTAGRPMTERDFNAWIAVRTVGEAVTRTGSNDPARLREFLRSPEFEVAGFKGQGLTFRTWNQQLRQPILLVGPRTLVSVSPQDQFLHQRTPLDTLGYDEPESSCRLEG